MSGLVESTLCIYNFPRFQEKLEGLNRKAMKIGFSPILYVKHDLVTVEERNDYGEKIVYTYNPVDIIHHGTIEMPGGWTLVATIDHFEGINNVVPGKQLPIYYRDRQVCDHCGKERNRKETFVIENQDGQTMQVGRSCLGLYFGISPEHMLSQIDFFNEIHEDDDEGWGCGRGVPSSFGLDDFMSHAALMIRTSGWLSRSSAAEQMKSGAATADLAWFNITETKGSLTRINPSEIDKGLGKRTADWMRSLESRENLSDYMYNLMTIGKNGFVTHKSAGYAASAINAMQREIEEKTNNAQKIHLGVVGQKLGAEVRLVSSYAFDSGYGISYKHRFLDHSGNVIIWNTNKEIEAGKDYYIEGRIKEHATYRNEPQTVVTRCKIEEN